MVLDALARNWVKDRSPVKDFARWFYPPSEWTGNPFLHPIERLRIYQAWAYLSDEVFLREGEDEIRARMALKALALILNFRIEGPDHFVVTCQRIEGLYGPPGHIGETIVPVAPPGIGPLAY